MKRRTTASNYLGGAIISPNGNYRYKLWRNFSGAVAGKSGVCTFVMLNPSTADAEQDDPTIRRCVRFAWSWGYTQLNVVNLFAFRTSEPDGPGGLREAHQFGVDIVGSLNDWWLQQVFSKSDLIVAGWGNLKRGFEEDRAKFVLQLARKCVKTVHALKVNRTGHPAHPLYLPAGLGPILFQRPGKPARIRRK